MGMTVRGPVVADVSAMARVLVESWRETYRDLMPDEYSTILRSWRGGSGSGALPY